MRYHPVVDRFPVPLPLDPLSAALLVAALVAAAFLTARRPSYGLVALVLVTPVAFAHQLFGTTLSLPKAVLAGALLGLCTYRGAWQLLRRRPAPLLLGALGLIVVVTALTAYDAAFRAPVARETLKSLEYGAFFVAAFLCYALDPNDRAVCGAVAIAAIGVGLSALAQEFVGAPSGLYIGQAIVPRIAGLLEGPNQLSAYAEIAAATLGAWAVARRSRLGDAALAIVIFADVLTFSRAGWIGLALVGALLWLLYGNAARRGLRAALAGLLAGAAAAIGWAIYARTPSVLRASLEGSSYAGGVGNRSELWRAAWRMWRAHPLLGVGAGNFELVLPAYGLYGVRTHANSWYLQSLAEGGLALFAATLGLLYAIALAFGPLRAERLRTASPWIVAALGATLALAVHQTVDYLVFYPKVGGAWWILLGIAAAAVAREA